MKKKKEFKKIFNFLNQNFLIGLFIGLIFGSILMEGQYLYLNNEDKLTVNHTDDFKQKSKDMAKFIIDYQKTLEKTVQNSTDDLEKLLCFKLHEASALYLKQITEDFQQINKLKDPDKTLENLEELLDLLRKEREKLENKVRI